SCEARARWYEVDETDPRIAAGTCSAKSGPNAAQDPEPSPMAAIVTVSRGMLDDTVGNAASIAITPAPNATLQAAKRRRTPTRGESHPKRRSASPCVRPVAIWIHPTVERAAPCAIRWLGSHANVHQYAVIWRTRSPKIP